MSDGEQFDLDISYATSAVIASLPLEARLALFEEGLHALGLVGRCEEAFEGLALEVEAGAQGHVVAQHHRLLCRLHGERRQSGNAQRYGAGSALDLRIGN